CFFVLLCFLLVSLCSLMSICFCFLSSSSSLPLVPATLEISLVCLLLPASFLPTIASNFIASVGSLGLMTYSPLCKSNKPSDKIWPPLRCPLIVLRGFLVFLF